MRQFALGLHLMLLAACGESSGLTAPDAIRTMLEQSAAAWNAGDLDGFLSSYARDTATTFVGNRELLHGWDAVRANYAPSFDPGARRDSLRFEDMEIRMIDPLHAIVYARWVLDRPDGEPLSGPFTLVVEHQGSAWRIVHDHSSSDPG